jgi:hypothetical protein
MYVDMHVSYYVVAVVVMLQSVCLHYMGFQIIMCIKQSKVHTLNIN